MPAREKLSRNRQIDLRGRAGRKDRGFTQPQGAELMYVRMPRGDRRNAQPFGDDRAENATVAERREMYQVGAKIFQRLFDTPIVAPENGVENEPTIDRQRCTAETELRKTGCAFFPELRIRSGQQCKKGEAPTVGEVVQLAAGQCESIDFEKAVG